MYNALDLEKTAAVLLLPIFYTPMLVQCSRSTETNYLYLRVAYLIHTLVCFGSHKLYCTNYRYAICCGVPLASIYSALFSDVCDILLSFDWLGNDGIYFNKNDQKQFFAKNIAKAHS